MVFLWFVWSVLVGRLAANIQLNYQLNSNEGSIYFLGPANGTKYLSYENISLTSGPVKAT